MLEINIDITSVIAALGDLQVTQFPFALALALTRTAQRCQDAVRADMGSRFTLRNDWSRKGIIITPAKKGIRPFSEVKVGDLWAYLKLQERGGLKVPIGTRHYICIPTPAIRRSPTQTIPAALRPKALLNNPSSGVFILPKPPAPAMRGGIRLIVRRTGKGKGQLQTLYIMVRSGRIQSRLGLEEISRDVAAKVFGAEFDSAMAVAVATARR